MPNWNWKRRHPILHRATTPSRGAPHRSQPIRGDSFFCNPITKNKKKQRPPDVCAQEMGIEETVAARLGKVFRAALSLVGLFGLLRSWPRSARTVPRGWAVFGRPQAGIKSYVW